ncbi:GerMN domain-containing protein [Chakrabartyella piscis]|uniref:GerMN domain-containing protein n=1 Tax=Chakrabartyella piscis TaxID=2918914 RepID=UPI0029588849|nr:GerMN domain-containing protein [Chakrabartyella piscis]
MPLVQKKKWFGVFLSLLIMFVLVFVAIMVKDHFWQKKDNTVELYYTGTANKMKLLETEMTADSNEQLVLDVIAKLQSGSEGEGFAAVIPETLEVKSILLEDGIAYIDFSKEYYEMEAVEEILCRSSLVWSLTSLQFITSISLRVENEPLVSKSNVTYGLLHRQNVSISAEISPNTTEYAILKLYFANEDKSDLVMEDRVVEVIANQAKELSILEQLIAGPREESYTSVIPDGTKILDVATTSDGICYVNLSQEFVANHAGDAAGELLTIYSIVNSLAELDSVQKIQFLIEGEKMDVYKGHVDFGTPFVPVNGVGSIIG